MSLVNDMKVIGTCMKMCPEAEHLRRKKQRQLHKFETLINGEFRYDAEKCVKEFTRAAAGQKAPKANELRPPTVLVNTVKYLLTKIMMLTEDSWTDRYEFIFDRLRSVRQDMIFQDVYDVNCVKAMEYIVRFHIYSIYKSCELPIEMFDPYINGTHLRECLKRLLVFYNDNPHLAPHRYEFESYYILFHFGSSEALQHFLTLPQTIRTNALCQKVLAVTHSWLLGNFARALRYIKTLPFLCCVALLPHVESIRRQSLKVMNTGYSSTNCKYPLKKLIPLLLFDNKVEAISTCKYYGLNVDDNNVNFLKSRYLGDCPLLKMKRYQFIEDKFNQNRLPELFFSDI